MSDSKRFTPVPALATDPHSQFRAITSTPEVGDIVDRLAAAGLVVLAHDLPLHDAVIEASRIEANLSTDLADRTVGRANGAIGRVDPRQSRVVLSGGRALGMYVADCSINTEAQPPFHRLPSFGTHNPYHIVYLLNFPANESHTVQVSLQVFSAGTVRITGTGNRAAVILGQSSVPLTVPVAVTTSAEGFASIFIQRVGETGFDWFAAEVI